ncbi:MAG: redoxin domain-containing protein [Deltaproteobacteria bacterium]|nr:redoxin domain-containing protein [Deltaproteobacteria bacterium]
MFAPLARLRTRIQAAGRAHWYVRWGVDLVWITVFVAAVSAWQTRSHVRGDAPAFSAPTLDGGQVTLTSLRGRPVMLAFWAPWCVVCKQEAPNIEWTRDLVGDRARVLTVASAYRDTREVQRYVDDRAMASPVILGGDDVAARFRVEQYPTVYFLDEEGRIKNSVVGYTTTVGLLWRLWW